MRLKKWVIIVAALLVSVVGILGVDSASVFADESKDPDKEGGSSQVTCPTGTLREGKKVSSYAECNMEVVDEDEKVTAVGTRIINFGSGIVGFISVAVVVIGAIFIATSTGDPGKVKRGQMAILYGLIGVVVAFLAFAIVNFVITNVFKS